MKRRRFQFSLADIFLATFMAGVVCLGVSAGARQNDTALAVLVLIFGVPMVVGALVGGWKVIARFYFRTILWLALIPVAMLMCVTVIDVGAHLIQMIVGQGSAPAQKWSICLAAVLVGSLPTVGAIARWRKGALNGVWGWLFVVIVCLGGIGMAYLAAEFLWGTPAS
jgi:hypothetical protein